MVNKRDNHTSHKRRIKMIGCYVTGIMPRPKELVEATRAYERRKISADKLEQAFREATIKVIGVQASPEVSYVADGMLKWQDLLRPFTENLEGLKAGALARWFNNNTFYRKPIVEGKIQHKKDIAPELAYVEYLPRNIPWKAILPAPYTLVKLSENKFYKNERELMFSYAEILEAEVESLAKKGFKYIQLSDPALVYNPLKKLVSKDTLADVKEALKITVKSANAKTCLQTFFGDVSQIMPEALDFPADDLGIDLYETSMEKLKGYEFDKGVALGLVDARSSLIEDENELVSVAEGLIQSVYPSKVRDVFICPNCDLEFLPWERAEEKIRVISRVAKRLKAELGIHE